MESVNASGSTHSRLAEATYNELMERVHAAGDPVLPKNISNSTDAVGVSYPDKR